jgi:hypothetical protein
MRSTDVCSSQGPLVAWHGAPHDLRRGSPLPGEVVRSLVIVVLSITVYHIYTTNGAPQPHADHDRSEGGLFPPQRLECERGALLLLPRLVSLRTRPLTVINVIISVRISFFLFDPPVTIWPSARRCRRTGILT